jgi:hypothetical protein
MRTNQAGIHRFQIDPYDLSPGGNPRWKTEGCLIPCGAGAPVAWADMKTALSQKADTAMQADGNDDLFEAALRLAEDDPARGTKALRSIVADDKFDPDTRSEAAARLAEVGG